MTSYRVLQYVLWPSLMIATLIPAPVCAQSRERGPWWPHPVWGPKDQAGASNWITPEKVLRSLRLVRSGKIYEVGQIYEPGMPLMPGRSYSFNLKATSPVALGANSLVASSEILTAEIGQVGTQFDGLGHMGTRIHMNDGTTRDVYYNGFTWEEIGSPAGLRQLGIEHVRPIITRGILVDVAAAKNMDVLPHGYEVTLADVQAALRRQGIREEDIERGDAILFRYGWAKHWSQVAVYNDRPPGIGLEVARWVAARQPSMVGSDTYNTEVYPHPDSTLQYPVHQELIVRNGIFNLENMNLEELAAERVYQFLFIFTPVRFRGATGSPGRPIAVL